ncbi:unnamed protein product [Euphydryas editha]|uniref:BEN domain-containing protein n=1 Tax=Euphydryas editha TaxID=104508 RepID=A0AAU9TG15_EUPED|nr:unnamed protein product [Euphydryas editha]
MVLEKRKKKIKENPIRQKEDNPIDDHQKDTDIDEDDKNKIIAPANMSVLIPTDDQLDELDDDSQLFGQNHGNMFHIGHGIYCKTKICQLAAKSSSAATHVARKLLEGIFREETLIKCTISGKPPPQGKQRQLLPVVPMHSRAKKAIIEYSIQLAKKNKWTPRTLSQIETSIAQKLVEVKAKNRKNLELLAKK